MLSIEELGKLSIQEVAQTIDEHHKEEDTLYEVLASKITKRTKGVMTLSDENVTVAEYWLKVAKAQRKILAMDFDLDGFGDACIGFKFMVAMATENGNLSAKLRVARDIASSDCFTFNSIVRQAIRARQDDPVFALILEKEPNQRQSKKKDATTPAKDAPKSETTTPPTS
jgi:hypothetical protein